MKYDFTLSTPAKEDILGINDYIAADNPYAAAGVSSRIYEVLTLIRNNPKVGGKISERFNLKSDYLFFIVLPYTYMIFYTLHGQDITIHRVLDGRSDYLSTLGLKK